ncbi:MAG: acyltransferase domain-containing protein, partial [Polyangiaceae bacterium]
MSERVRAPSSRVKKIGFVFSGQGAQWFAMGRSLLTSNDTFRGVIEEVGAELSHLGWLAQDHGTLHGELNRDKATTRMRETHVGQPCLFALQVGLARVLADDGIAPAAVIGHSLGELAAAVVSGALSLEEATRIVFWRSACQALAHGNGAMAALSVSEDRARELVAKHKGLVDVAAVNGPIAITIAGDPMAVEAIAAEVSREKIFVRRLALGVPYHCYLMDSVEADFRAGLQNVTARASHLPFFSTVTATAADERMLLDLDYWYRNIRNPVLYAKALVEMARSGISYFVELGPHPALLHASADTFRAAGIDAVYITTLRRDGDDALELA